MNAEEVGTVAHDYDALQVVRTGDNRQPARRLLTIRALGFGNNLALRDATSQKVVVSHTALGVRLISGTPQSNDQGRNSLHVEPEGMVKARTQHGRWSAIVLRGSKYGYRIRCSSLVVGGKLLNLQVDPDAPAHRHNKHPYQQHLKLASGTGIGIGNDHLANTLLVP